ncbi:protein MIS12 homolog isoform X1 [Morus notabilis]|uniref:protein MIS12 homolog isoform X1 n=1 Tax=Morus notabilis TaxID=981085 RepID=UPI000CED1B59|nr:protein MIS12 homolog isoform X1 [Morus notabilis]
MEGTDSEAVFDSLNLNPQLFINEVFNTVDDLVDEAFNYYLEQASSTLRTDGTDRAEDLSKGVALIRKMIQSVLDKRLVMWEEYCFNHCFEVPEGFSLPKSEVDCKSTIAIVYEPLRSEDEPPSNSSVLQDALYDPNLDAQLDSLRNKLTTVGKESAVLNRELRALEKQSVASGNFAALINETLQSYKDNSFDQMFHEMTRIASELKIKMGKLQTKTMEETRQRKTERLHALNRDSFRLDFSNGIADVKLEDLQGFLAKMKNV